MKVWGWEMSEVWASDKKNIFNSSQVLHDCLPGNHGKHCSHDKRSQKSYFIGLAWKIYFLLLAKHYKRCLYCRSRCYLPQSLLFYTLLLAFQQKVLHKNTRKKNLKQTHCQEVKPSTEPDSNKNQILQLWDGEFKKLLQCVK